MLIPLLLAGTGCAVNPVTGKTELALIPPSQVLEIGASQYQPSQQAGGGVYKVDGNLTEYVASVGNRLGAVSDTDLPYEFVVLNDGTPNAWALPGGKIAVNRGLLTELENEAELAAVLGHEVVHAAIGHGAKSINRNLLYQGLMAATQLTVEDSRYKDYVVGGAQLGLQLISQSYSREAEREADYYGIRYMQRAGYNTRAAVTLQEKFVAFSEDRSSSWVEGLFASHPPSIERVRANEATLLEYGPGGDLGRQRFDQALAYLRSKRSAYEAFDRAQQMLAADEFDAAAASVRRALEIEPAEPRFYGLEGDIALARQQYAAATLAFDNAIERDPDYFRYFLGRGFANAKLGRKQNARDDFERSNSLLPTAAAMNELGKLALAGGERTAAKQLFKEAAAAGGALGDEATAAFVRLDVADAPANYIEAQATVVASSGALQGLLTNRTNLTIRNVVLEFQATVNDQRRTRQVQVNELAPGAQASVAAGWRFAESDLVTDVLVRVVSATPP